MSGKGLGWFLGQVKAVPAEESLSQGMDNLQWTHLQLNRRLTEKEELQSEI
jgi:hypothetical protein